MASPVIKADGHITECSKEPFGDVFSFTVRGQIFYYKKGSWDETGRFRSFQANSISSEGCSHGTSYADCKLKKIRWDYSYPWINYKSGKIGKEVLDYVCS